jgi:hypothetical protein
MRQTGYAIDWTASLEREENKKQDPWESLVSMKPHRPLPEAPLTAYLGTKFEIFAMYLPRKGISACERVRAYASGHVKIMECRGKLYLTTIDGMFYERNKPDNFNIKKELRRQINA